MEGAHSLVRLLIRSRNLLETTGVEHFLGVALVTSSAPTWSNAKHSASAMCPSHRRLSASSTGHASSLFATTGPHTPSMASPTTIHADTDSSVVCCVGSLGAATASTALPSNARCAPLTASKIACRICGAEQRHVLALRTLTRATNSDIHRHRRRRHHVDVTLGTPSAWLFSFASHAAQGLPAPRKLVRRAQLRAIDVRLRPFVRRPRQLAGRERQVVLQYDGGPHITCAVQLRRRRHPQPRPGLDHIRGSAGGDAEQRVRQRLARARAHTHTHTSSVRSGAQRGQRRGSDRAVLVLRGRERPCAGLQLGSASTSRSGGCRAYAQHSPLTLQAARR